MDLLHKARIGVLGHLSELLDRVVNTPAGVAQLIRDLETAMSDLAGSVAEAQGNVTGTERDIAQTESKIAKLESDADLLLSDGDPTNDDSAIELQAQANDQRDALSTLQEQLVQAKALRDELSDAMDKLTSRHSEMVLEYRKLRIMDAGARAKNRAADAIQAAGGALSSSGADSVDNVARAIQARADKADARLALATGSLSSAEGGKARADVRNARALEALRARHHEITSAALAAQSDQAAG